MEPKIQVLPDTIANQIAAGEVIERPAAVLKELLENSLDAGATAIDIAFEQAGISSIVIQDNGCGMTPEDARLSLLRHATSKLKDIKDLEAILSFGFRGEAVPSIASVSRFSLKTRPADRDTGYELEVEGGTVRAQKPCGMPVGTIIAVRDLFYNVPARRKFLKSATTEANHLVNNVRIYALAQPRVAFELKVDGRQNLKLAAANNLLERIAELLGPDVAAQLIPIKGQDADDTVELQLSGFIGHPKFHRTNREGIYCFVNGRPIDSKLMQYALMEAYRGQLPEGRFPWAFLNLDIEPHAVDVNVHPAKREVRFRDEGQLRAQLMHVLSSTLQKALHQELLDSKVFVQAVAKPLTHAHPTASILPKIIPAAAFTPRPNSEPTSRSAISASQGMRPTGTPQIEAREIPQALQGHQLPWRFLTALPPRWLLFQTQSEGLMIVHAKAARERILYEEIMQAMEKRAVKSQMLLVPITFDLPASLKELWEQTQTLWAQFGYVIEPFGKQTYRVLETPPWLDPHSCVAMLETLLSDIHEKKLSAKSDLLWAECARRMAARPQAVSPLSYDTRTA
ncbi:MAG: hypothetical protein B7X06_00005, partial [Verrucomicrobia bacterium 21-51-4]